jgi:hypothetical protein
MYFLKKIVSKFNVLGLCIHFIGLANHFATNRRLR